MNDLFDSAPAAPDGIRVGIGGWTYAPWRGGMFYPQGLVQRRELEYASRHVNSIEINGTYYGTQKPDTYARWRDETPPGFLFSAKAPKRITGMRRLAGAGAQVEDFIGGIVTLGEKLGPLVWQFEHGRTLDLDDLAVFLDLLPQQGGGRRLRHVLEVRDPASVGPRLLDLARTHGVATVFTDSPDYPSFADLGTDFVYARLMRSRANLAHGYPPKELRAWAAQVQAWRRGEDPDTLPHAGTPMAAAKPREVFVYFISAAKERNPAAAMALLAELGVDRDSGPGTRDS
ncbi:DUF72 domain-containing protein [Xanthomonas sp. NCPPB 2654]|uniref:DUF72 domain-containing protein n=1 Tax=unclassified Xanthomonas TaxID=2643310 RepID=UPI0021DF4370|nr:MULTISPECIES: DUF72 domain-containing protein [unclassified Xanthomonas]MDL5367354.1 DUF72 domain-containing protein [Xanthomonas sp. NCPPB 2654]UYC19317.1 DUF72 domain-containing protein [Xanthomonas sp. CFBP 8443]